MPPAKRAPSSSSKSNSSAKPAAKPATGSQATEAAGPSGAAKTSTARTARSGVKGTGTAAKRGAKHAGSTATAAATSTKRASGGDGIASVAEQLVKGTIKPQDLVIITRDRIRETLDEAASRGRVTRKDADDLVTELVRLGREQSGDFRSEIESLLGRVETATKRARGSKPVD